MLAVCGCLREKASAERHQVAGRRSCLWIGTSQLKRPRSGYVTRCSSDAPLMLLIQRLLHFSSWSSIMNSLIKRRGLFKYYKDEIPSSVQRSQQELGDEISPRDKTPALRSQLKMATHQIVVWYILPVFWIVTVSNDDIFAPFFG